MGARLPAHDQDGLELDVAGEAARGSGQAGPAGARVAATHGMLKRSSSSASLSTNCAAEEIWKVTNLSQN